MNVTYSHRQKALWVPLTSMLFVLMAIGIFASILHRDVDGSIIHASLAAIGCGFPGAIIFWLFDGLLVEVNTSQVILKFGHGPIKKSIERKNITSATTVRNKAIYGWGIRLTPHGWLWNIYGLDAIEITYPDGKRFRIGSDDPQQLLTAIHKESQIP